MTQPSAIAPNEPRYELRFTDLNDRGRGFVFPCDGDGHVDVDKLSDQGRMNYLYARAAIGQELSAPVVSRAS